MKLYIKQKVFSWGDKFTVKDEAGRDRYYVEGEIFTADVSVVFVQRLSYGEQ